LDRLERSGDLSVASLSGALVEPLARNLGRSDGRSWLLVLAEAAHRLGTPGLLDEGRAHVDSVRRLSGHLDRLLSGSPAHRRQRIAQAILVTPTLLADIARHLGREPMSVAWVRRRVGDTTSFVCNALTE
jgi:hypothetical protein